MKIYFIETNSRYGSIIPVSQVKYGEYFQFTQIHPVGARPSTFRRLGNAMWISRNNIKPWERTGLCWAAECFNGTKDYQKVKIITAHQTYNNGVRTTMVYSNMKMHFAKTVNRVGMKVYSYEVLDREYFITDIGYTHTFQRRGNELWYRPNSTIYNRLETTATPEFVLNPYWNGTRESKNWFSKQVNCQLVTIIKG
jgi:hypothetical protein